MKTNILTYACVAAAMALTSCDGAWQPPVDAEGKADLSTMNIENDDAEKLVQTEQSRAGVDTSGYIIGIYKSGETDVPVKTWTFGEMPEIVALPVGDYTVEAESHKVGKAEWEKPYFTGKQNFKIEAGKITQVDPITCKFSNIKVTITVTDDLKALLTDDATFTVVANDEGELVYTKDETRAGYFQALEGSNTMVVKFKGTMGGTMVEENFPFTDIAAGQHRAITFRTKDGPKPPQPTGGVENGGIGIDAGVIDKDIDGNVTYEDDIIPGDRPGQEDPKDPVGPEDPDKPNPPVGNDPIDFKSETIDLEGVNNPGTLTGGAVVNILSDKGLAHLYVTIKSETLNKDALMDFGLDTNFDLAYPGDLEEGLSGLNFPTGAAVIGAKKVEFAITDFMLPLSAFPGDHTFIVKAEDVEGNSKELVLKFNSPAN